MEFTELPLFEKYVYAYLSDDEYAAFQWHIAQNPDVGDLIRGGGGIRKVRWMAKVKAEE